MIFIVYISAAINTRVLWWRCRKKAWDSMLADAHLLLSTYILFLCACCNYQIKWLTYMHLWLLQTWHTCLYLFIMPFRCAHRLVLCAVVTVFMFTISSWTRIVNRFLPYVFTLFFFIYEPIHIYTWTHPFILKYLFF